MTAKEDGTGQGGIGLGPSLLLFFCTYLGLFAKVHDSGFHLLQRTRRQSFPSPPAGTVHSSFRRGREEQQGRTLACGTAFRVCDMIEDERKRREHAGDSPSLGVSLLSVLHVRLLGWLDWSVASKWSFWATSDRDNSGGIGQIMPCPNPCFVGRSFVPRRLRFSAWDCIPLSGAGTAARPSQ